MAGETVLERPVSLNWSEIALRLPSCADGRGTDGQDLAAMLPCPLVVDGALIGGIVIYHTVPGYFTDEHRRLLGRCGWRGHLVVAGDKQAGEGAGKGSHAHGESPCSNTVVDRASRAKKESGEIPGRCEA